MLFFSMVFIKLIISKDIEEKFLDKPLSLYTSSGSTKGLVRFPKSGIFFRDAEKIIGIGDKVHITKAAKNRYTITVFNSKICYFPSRKRIEPCKAELDEEDGWSIKKEKGFYMIKSKHNHKNPLKNRKCLKIDVSNKPRADLYKISAENCDKKDKDQLFSFKPHRTAIEDNEIESGSVEMSYKESNRESSSEMLETPFESQNEGLIEGIKEGLITTPIRITTCTTQTPDYSTQIPQNTYNYSNSYYSNYQQPNTYENRTQPSYNQQYGYNNTQPAQPSYNPYQQPSYNPYQQPPSTQYAPSNNICEPTKPFYSTVGATEPIYIHTDAYGNSYISGKIPVCSQNMSLLLVCQ
ncbi:hypothetical protein CWI39_1761p0010 [Hamiltosporidium magnivora]|uniref:Uncharacterized protein n=1 Tax=Hamiltosporidium magnivora TaxID=148818 RepID=A0A4Q9KZT5_9MICR|nr:hypothetical protein CWI39_1761p0010 [Hamiltosporidium magnivora]